MKILKNLHLLERLDGLIRRKATGTPQQLASRLALSKRQVFRLINDLKDMGLPVNYSHQRQSYVYDKEVSWKFSVSVREHKVLKVGNAAA